MLPLALLITTLCLLLGLVETAQVRLGGGDVVESSWWVAFWRVVPSWALLGMLTPLVVLAVDRWPVRGSGWARALSIHVALALPFAALHLFLTAVWGTVRPASLGLGLAYGFDWLVSRYFVYDILAYGALAGVVHAFRYRRESVALKEEATALVSALQDAQRRVTAGKLDPHFVFNTINAIAGLAARGDRPEVVRTLAAFGGLLRATLDGRHDQLVRIADEVKLVESYLQIQKARFGSRLQTRWHVDPEAIEDRIPRLVLQTLVENAINHAISRNSRGGEVGIRIERTDGAVRLEVLDPGTGRPGPQPGAGDSGLGLDALRARLETHFGSRASFRLCARPEGGSQAVLIVPADSDAG